MVRAENATGWHSVRHNIESLGSLRDQSPMPWLPLVPLAFLQTPGARHERAYIVKTAFATLEFMEHVAHPDDLRSLGGVSATTKHVLH